MVRQHYREAVRGTAFRTNLEKPERLWHYLKPNANSETIHSCIFVDTETDDVVVDKKRTGYRLRFGWAAETRRNAQGAWTKPTWRKFTDVSEFWLWAMSFPRSKHKTWIWCHNSSFDFPVLDAFRHLPDIGWKLVSAIIDAPPTVVRYRSGKKTLVLCDTLNIWRMSLAELGRKVGLEKLERPGEWINTELDDQYCRRDVEIIYKAITDWSDLLRDKDMGGFCPTIAAQAMRTFRHKYMDTKILIDGNDVSHKLARKCYHGGRCEASYIGELHQAVHSVDVNSMYPFVMSYAEMPVRLKGISTGTLVQNLPSLLKQYCLCAHVALETDEPFAAVVINGKLCFPTGRFDAYLSTPEIEYAVNLNAIREVHLCAAYEREIPFRAFALDLYKNKEDAVRRGDKVEASHWKLLLNSFYGKWGQSGRIWTEVGTCDPHVFTRIRQIDAQTRIVKHIRQFGGFVFERAQDGESRESHPAIAAHICAHARMVLWALIRQVPPKHYLYCDTDGLLVTDTGLDALRDRLDDFVLGGLKHVKTYSHVRIYGCKDLVLDDKQTLKGIRPSAQKLDNGKYRQLRWHSLRSLLGDNSINMPLTTVIDKCARSPYTKGTVGLDGFVAPLHLGGV